MTRERANREYRYCAQTRENLESQPSVSFFRGIQLLTSVTFEMQGSPVFATFDELPFVLASKKLTSIGMVWADFGDWHHA